MMKFTDKEISELRTSVSKRLSAKRFAHTLGVEKMAVLMGEKIMPDRISELRAAALLHDISKEYSEAEQLLIAKEGNIALTDEDMAAPPLWHSITAPCVVKRDFDFFATEDILSAVANHTVGSPDMSAFDGIILLADYIEEGRRYDRCVALRESFLSELSACKSADEAIMALNRAVYQSLENNIQEFVSRGNAFHSRTKATRDAFLAKIER